MRPFFISLLLLFFIHAKAENHALLIGISKYPVKSGWKELSSFNDLIHLEAALKLNGFKKSNIDKLENAFATKQGIMNRLKALEDGLTEGDIVYIHFSGHGQQIKDNDKDEIDGLDEAIVPYDSPLYFKKNVYEGEKLIRDDELNDISTSIRKKIGPSGQLVFVIDACNSGTGTRGNLRLYNRVRGTDVLMAPSTFVSKPKKSRKEKTMGIYSENKRERLAPMASYYSTRAKELNYETFDAQLQPIGGLSYAISSIISEASMDMSFEEFYDRIVVRMRILNPKQHPQWEGTLGVSLFGGNAKNELSELYSITEQLDEYTLKVELGTLSGTFEGSQVEVYSLDQQKVINKGTVRKASLTNSIIVCESKLNLKYDELVKVKVVKKERSGLEVVMRYDISENSSWDGLISKIKNNEFILESNCNADLYLQNSLKKGLCLTDMDGSILFESKSKDCEKELLKSIVNYGQAKFLKGYDNPSSSYKFDIKLWKTNCDHPIKDENQLKKVKHNLLKIGECIQIGIENIGTKPAYFSLLDIQPNNEINLIIPNPYSNKTAEDHFLNPGQSYLTDFIIDVAEPIGEETLKLIVTENPIHLLPIISNHKKYTRGAKTLDLFQDMQKEANNLEDVGVETLFFEIEK